ncbi:MAG: hypothetical protein V4608_09225 [Bacteroidota bacterium]
MFKNRFFIGTLLFSTLLLISGCKKEEEEPPTKVLMQGTWELTAATNASGQNILGIVAFPVSAIQLTDDNGMVGTQGPMFTYTVYGGSQWVSASSKIEQAFDYANFRFNTGEYFVESGHPTRFTVEAKLQATALAGGLTDVLTIMGVNSSWLQQVIYHKFINVKVTIPKLENSDERNTMIWEFDNQTTASYNYKDSQGNIVLWGGWPVNNFSKGTFTFTKRVSGLNDIVTAHL